MPVNMFNIFCCYRNITLRHPVIIALFTNLISLFGIGVSNVCGFGLALRNCGESKTSSLTQIHKVSLLPPPTMSDRSPPYALYHTSPATPATTTLPVCDDNEDFKSCGTACEPTCATPNPRFCTEQCIVNVCQCSAGFVRAPNGKCVRQSSCPLTTPPPPTSKPIRF